LTSNQRIIVTGGAGFIGSNIVDSLAESNEVVAVDNMHTGSPENLKNAVKKGARLERLDVKNIDKLNFKPDVIMHLGMYSSSPMYKENNRLVAEVLDGAVSIFKFAKKNNAKVVFASTSSIYNGQKPPYKENLAPLVTDFYTEARYGVERLGELYNKLDGTDVTALRLFSVYGRHEEAKKTYANLVSQFLWDIKASRQPVIYGDGSQTRDFTFVDDVVDAFKKGSERKGFNVYNVGTGTNYTLNQLIEKLAKATGKDVKPKYIPMPMKNYVMETLADTRKAEKELGFRARYSLDDGIRELISYYKM
jgi:UDP-glucose 4-epimerase